MSNKKENTDRAKSKKVTLKKLFENNLLMGFFIGFIVFVIFACLYQAKVLDIIEDVTLQWRFNHFHNDSKASDNCVVVAMDFDSVKNLGQPPWNRKIYAELIEALNFYTVEEIAFDLTFFRSNDKYPQGDIDFAKTLKAYKNITIGSVVAYDEKQNKPKYSSQEFGKIKEISIKPENQLKFVTLKDMFSSLKLTDEFMKNEAFFIIFPFKDILMSLNSTGILSHNSGDNVILNSPLVFKSDSNYFVTLALASYMNSIRVKSLRQEKNRLVIANKEIPVFGDNLYMINWYQIKENERLYKTYSVFHIIYAYRALLKKSKDLNIPKEELQQNIDDFFTCSTDNKCSKELENLIKTEFKNDYIFDTKLVKDKYVFIGVTDISTGTKDYIKTPISNQLPGVYMHANILDNILQGDFIARTSPIIVLFILFVLPILSGITVLGVKNAQIGISLGVAYCLYFVIPLCLFRYYNVYLDLIYIELAVIVTVVLCVVYQWMVVDKDKRLISGTLSNYLAPQILNEVLSDPSKVKMGGNRKDISILFSDIRGFTTISERCTPEEVVEFLNEYFDAMIDAIMQTGGTVDKFIGDAIMAFWGAPVDHENHAELAVKGAMGMLEALKDLKRKWALQGKDYPEVNIGIGVNTGEAIVGHVGSTKIKSYTVIGDSVNLASRLEGLNKQYADFGDSKKSIIISEFTYERVKDIFEVEYLDEVKVKGKDIAVKIYKVMGIKGERNEV